MLFDLIDKYDKEKKEFLWSLWIKLIDYLINTNDLKKIVSFLNKCWIIGVDEKNKKIYLWVPNEFILSQVKKFFNKELNIGIQQIYNPQFRIELMVFDKFQSWRHPLQHNLQKYITKTEQPIDNFLDKWTKKELKDMFGVLFDSKYKFNNFIAWSANNMAFSAASQVAEKPWLVYNPLFIYWDVWLGKTHLLQAIGNYNIENNTNKTVVYLPTTKLIDEIVESIRKNKLWSLMKKMEDVDILILDDVQFLAEKEKTQEIFHNIFNDFHLRKKQIVISSDRPPRDLKLLEARLRSRFSLWLVVDIKKPDFETRFAILKSKLKNLWEEFDRDLIEIIAKHVNSNIRELEWALNILLTKKNLLGKTINENDVYESLETLWYNIKDKMSLVDKSIDEANTKNNLNNNNFNNIVEYVSNYYNVSIFDIKWDSRKKEVSLTRQMLMYIAKKYFQWTLEKIWDFFGWKNHATVIYAINNFEKTMKFNKKIHNDFNVILEELNL